MTNSGVGMDPSCNGVGKDTSKQSSHIEGRPHSAHIGEAKLGKDDGKNQLLAIKFAGIDKGVVAVLFDQANHATDIM